MDGSSLAKIAGSDMTVSDKIRALAAAGYPRAEIARALGKRYQHVRNVLEADKLHPPRKTPRAATRSPTALEEPNRPFAAVQRLSVESEGVVRLSPEVLAALQAGPGSVIIAELQDDGLKLFSTSAAWDRVRRRVQQLGINPKRDLVAELIAERRAEAARDD